LNPVFNKVFTSLTAMVDAENGIGASELYCCVLNTTFAAMTMFQDLPHKSYFVRFAKALITEYSIRNASMSHSLLLRLSKRLVDRAEEEIRLQMAAGMVILEFGRPRFVNDWKDESVEYMMEQWSRWVAEGAQMRQTLTKERRG
jgi:hypothetical protein